MTTVNHLVPQRRLVFVVLVALAGCVPARAAREDRERAERMRTRCPASLEPLATSHYFSALNAALDGGDLVAIEQAGQALLETVRRDAAWVFHSAVPLEGPDRSLAIFDMRVALDTLTVGPGAPLRLGPDRFVLAPEPASRLVAAALARGDRAAARAWLDAAGAGLDETNPLFACLAAEAGVAP